ncbi:LysR family transcriptional regulator [Ramlibacter sp. AW1]|uniref:LysR family transcriptional regulator n=1 Tax=Ramlibacter aurantiacus TaxID=2801330 RepID=A0A936ZR83_9BURK|nr:LysR substrate-binding domain-containing protein [Ramlibacter aurantiacus]MBL0419204.1 LysR family transcriptional regulator [Ramlibacter aurantiacus]
MRFDIVDLRLFVAVASCGNLTRAAEGFPIAVAAASARIKALEESLGVLLLERSSRGVSLTPAGEMFLARALAILKETAGLREELTHLHRGASGLVRLAANTNAINEFLPQLLAGFLSLHPRVNIEMHEHTSQDIVNAVDRGDADIGIIAGRVSLHSLQSYPFRRDRLVAITAQNHKLLARGEVLRFYQLLDYEFIGLGDRASLQIWLAKQALLLGQNMRMRIQVNSFDAITRLVAAGVGVSVIPESTARRLQRQAPIEVIPLDEEWADRELKIVLRQLATLTPHARKLFDHLSAPPPAPHA